MSEWYPQAVWWPGPVDKVGYNGIYIRQHKGAIYHSMEGRWQDALSRLMSSDKVSWHLSLTYEGLWFQHYALSDVLWHGGCTFAGMLGAVECEGRVGEPLTRAQVRELAEFTAWQAENEDWPSIERRVTLWEHREMWTYGAAPTACPSDRIPWQEVIDLATIDTQARKDTAVLKAAQHLAGLAFKGEWQDLANALKYLGVTAQ